MNAKQNRMLQDIEKLKKIPKWTSNYAKNRNIHFWIIITFSIYFYIPLRLGDIAYRSGNMVLYSICTFVLIISIISLIIISVPRWGNKIIEKITKRIYANEGSILISTSKSTKKKKWLGIILLVLYFSCAWGCHFWGVWRYFPIKYIQPVTAILIVPCLVIGYFFRKPAISPITSLLFAALYGIHAVLIVAGVPIQFSKPWEALNVLMPFVGYGIICGLISYIYSRYALKKLKNIAHCEGDTANEV